MTLKELVAELERELAQVKQENATLKLALEQYRLEDDGWFDSNCTIDDDDWAESEASFD